MGNDATMSPMLPLRPTSAGPKSTVCEVQRWKSISVEEAVASKERYVRSDPKNPLCEVFRWVAISVDEALRTGERGRCVECKEPVRPHQGAVNGMAPHF